MARKRTKNSQKSDDLLTTRQNKNAKKQIVEAKQSIAAQEKNDVVPEPEAVKEDSAEKKAAEKPAAVKTEEKAAAAEKPAEKKTEKATEAEKPAEKKAEKATEAEKPAEKKAEKATEAEKKAEKAAEAEKPAEKKAEKAAETEKKAAVEDKPAPKKEEKTAEDKADKAEPAKGKKPELEKEPEKAAEKAEPEKAAAEPAEAEKAAEKEEPKKPAAKRAARKTRTTRKTTSRRTSRKSAKAETPAKEEPVKAEETKKEPEEVKKPEEAKEPEKAVKTEEPEVKQEAEPLPTPRRSVAFIGSECYPFVKTGGLGDVMYALPKALTRQNCDVKVILPRYRCIPQEYQEKMIYRGSFEMDLCADGTRYYVGIMEYVWDGVVYDFIDNEFFFTAGDPYVNLVDDIPKFCYFGKAALAALNFMDWIPDVIHCHDWQAGLVPIYLREMFSSTPLSRSKVILTIHNLRFQGKYDTQMISYWSNLPMHLFNKDVLKESVDDANMMKGGLTYSNMITTVSGTYAGEIQTPEFGENLDAHLRYHSGKLRGIVNGIDYDMWNSAADELIKANYDRNNVIEQKKKNKLALQEMLGLNQNEDLFVIGLVSRLTNQKGLDLVNAILPNLIDGNTQVVVLGTGDAQYEDSFRYYEGEYKGSVCSNIMYDEGRAHQIYAGCDAILIPSMFEPCGLTQLIGMHYGTIPIVRETGGLKDTVLPYNQYTNEGNGFSFDRYESGLLLDAINRAKTVYFTERQRWDEMVVRDMDKDVSWENSAKQYRQLYVDLTS